MTNLANLLDKQTRHNIFKPLQLLKARINRGDHQNCAETIKLNEETVKQFNCLGSDEINQKIIPSGEVEKK